MTVNVKQEAIFVSNRNKTKDIVKLNNTLNLGYYFVDSKYMPEANNSAGGIIYILEKQL